MNASQAYETYLNGNITDFKQWLKKTTKLEICQITYLWLEDGHPLLKLKGYILGY